MMVFLAFFLNGSPLLVPQQVFSRNIFIFLTVIVEEWCFVKIKALVIQR